MLEHWPKGLQIGLPFDGILFSAFEPIQGHKVQHLLVTCGRLKSSFICDLGEMLNTPNELCPALVSGLTVQPCSELRCSAAGFLHFCPFWLCVCNKYILKTLLLQNCATPKKVCKKTSETSAGQSLLGGI